MKALITFFRRMVLIASLGWIANWAEPASAQTNADIRIVEPRGVVEILRPGSTRWTRAATDQTLDSLDRVRTGTNSSLGILWFDQSIVRFGSLTEMEIMPPETGTADRGLHLFQGLLSFFHRDKPGRIRVISGGASAGIEGTEFVMETHTTNGYEQTTLSVIDGKVRFYNAKGALVVTNGGQSIAEPGTAPRRTPGFIANNILQWCFYYPGILDLNDLSFTAAEKNLLGESFAAYRAGDLNDALAKYPAGRVPGSDAERVYYAALLLSIGHIKESEKILDAINANEASGKYLLLSGALRQLIAAVQHEPGRSTLKPQLSTELLAASYYEQSQTGPKALDNALKFARRAVTNSPDFGFGWERMAELEFSFGRTDRAFTALNKALSLSPRNAQALSLKGFLLAAQNKTREAIDWFDRALAVDPALGNAWLGRGLCRIRHGDTKAGREDLLIAAAMEPQRSTLRSYLGKAFGDAGDTSRATHELHLAKQLDTNDPTAWLYSALLNEQNNHINEAIRDLEKSQELNNNRGVYRSGLLLDQDRAVRSANLARIYHEAGLDEVALREASRAVNADYENYSAHLFLANSYEQLRASSPFDLRYETPAFSEYLIASLLGPADGRLLAQPVSQSEYTRLFDRDSFGFSSSTEYLSRGAWSQYAAQYGTLKNTSYAVEADYNWDPGQTPNGSQESRQLSFKLKQMLTPNDGLFVQVLDFHRTSGDTSQRYNQNQVDIGYDVHEKQEPSFLIGFDHKWSDAQHTLLLGSRFDDSLSLIDPHGGTRLLAISGDGSVTNFVPTELTEKFHSRLIVNSFEVQHMVNLSHLQTIAGLRFQDGSYDQFNNQSYFFKNNANPDPNEIDWSTFFFDRNDGNPVVTNQSLRVHSLRITPYLYEYWHVVEPLWLIGGLTYDYQSIPRNALFAPLSDDQEIQRKLSPKAALIWTPTPRSVVRAAYSQSLGGASLDQSVRLEPTQLAGFVQAYRNLIPDSLAGGIGGASFETADISLEHRFLTGTYVALSAQLLRSTANQSVGAFLHDANTADGPAVQLVEQLHFRERSVAASVHQLLGDCFSVGLRYQLSEARLKTDYPQIDPGQGVNSLTDRGVLHLFGLNGVFQHPCGFFASAEGQWWEQQLHDNLSNLPGDQFWQVNLLAGYHSPHRHFEITVGLLNVTDQNYRLSPINLYPNLARDRTFVTRLQLNF
jgi:tetratricopeptide (TPR) repeat protein